MAFILASDGRDEDVAGAFSRYRKYLQEHAGLFPPNAYAVATSDWYFNFSDHRCPHDSWLKTSQLFEAPSGDRHTGRRPALIITLLGAYHDGIIELRYPNVWSYAFNLSDGATGHRDWRYDELRVSDRGTLIHEIEWCGQSETGRWLIEASDLEFRWLPRC